MLNKDGKVKVASNRNEIGLKIDRNDSMCVTCHAKTLEIRPVNLVIKEGSERLYRNVLPIYNKNECHKCHNPSETLSGMMLVDYSMKMSDEVFGLYIRNFIYTSLLAFIVIGSVVYILIELLVIRRLDTLKKGVVQFRGKGELETPIEIKGSDEIKELADTFNSMAERVKDYTKNLEDMVKDRTKELEERIEELERFRKATIQREFRGM